MENPASLTLTYTKKNVSDRTIRNGQSRNIDIDIHKNKTLEIRQSGMDNLETLTLTYTRKRRQR